MGQVPAKGFAPPQAYGLSQQTGNVNQVQKASINPQTPLLPPNFMDPGNGGLGTQGTAQALNPFVSPAFGGGGGGYDPQNPNRLQGLF